MESANNPNHQLHPFPHPQAQKLFQQRKLSSGIKYKGFLCAIRQEITIFFYLLSLYPFNHIQWLVMRGVAIGIKLGVSVEIEPGTTSHVASTLGSE